MTEDARQQFKPARERPRRSLAERFLARYPGLGWRLADRILSRPPSSALRRRFLALIARRSYAALSRGDIGLNERTRRGEVITLRDGHIDEHQVFASWEEALEEAGLPGGGRRARG